ncbi:MAG: flagellar motor switch protein FliG [Clostridiales bacterium]|jgi:flagellar motor switch protein FliG|nr:flagellar motor switch protein FliG [Clostridiales bacterium]
MAQTTAADLTGREKAAILLITLGPEKSAQVFQHLKEDEIETLTLEIANISTVMPDIKEDVLEEFYQICLAQKYITEGGITYAKQILEKALGEAKAFEVINKLTVSLQVRPFDFIRKVDVSQILNFIQSEHPQTIALILSYLRPKQAAEVLSELSADKQADVARRIALMDRTSPDVIKEVEKVLEKKLSSMLTEDFTTVGGVDSVVEILNSVDRATERHIMDTLDTEDTALSEEIRNKMFVFEDILTLDNRSIQTILRQDIDNRELAVALKGASLELQNLIFSNQSKRLAAMIKEDMDYMGPIRKSDVEEAQQKIVNVIRRLQETGEIIVSRGGGDDIIA